MSRDIGISFFFFFAISRDESASATYVLKERDGDEEMTEEWIKYHRLQPSYNEFEFRNSQVCQMLSFG